MSRFRPGQSLPEKMTQLATEQVRAKTNLWPAIADQLGQSSAKFNFKKNRPALRLSSVVMALVALLAFSAVAYGIAPALIRLFETEPGTGYIFQKGLGKELKLTQMSGTTKVTLEHAYADANRVVLAFSVEGGPRKNIDVITQELRDEQGNIYRPMRAFGDGEQQTRFTVMQFETASGLKGKPAELKLHAEIIPHYFNQIGENGPNVKLESVELAPVEFDFSVPYVTGTELAINQTVTDKGVAITLEKVIISPSGTRLFFSSSRPDVGNVKMSGWTPIVVLNASGQDASMNIGFSSPRPSPLLPDITEKLTWEGLSVSPLSEKTGQWQVHIKELVGFKDMKPEELGCKPVENGGSAVCTLSAEASANTQIRIAGNWTFKFNYSK